MFAEVTEEELAEVFKVLIPVISKTLAQKKDVYIQSCGIISSPMMRRLMKFELHKFLEIVDEQLQNKIDELF